MSLVCDSQAAGAAQEVTGPGDPLRLTIARELDLAAGTLSLSFSLSNRLSAEIKNIIVRYVKAIESLSSSACSSALAQACWMLL